MRPLVSIIVFGERNVVHVCGSGMMIEFKESSPMQYICADLFSFWPEEQRSFMSMVSFFGG